MRDALRERSDDELLELVRRRSIDLTGGIWDVLRERKLDERVVREIMTLLVTPAERACDDYLTRFHAADALMKITGFPAEMVECLGPANNSARLISTDFEGEPKRQEQLRSFWQDFKQHCLGIGLEMTWEPPWPETFIRYQVEQTLERPRPSDKPVNPRSLRDKLRHVNQVCLKEWEAPEGAEQSATEIIRDESGAETERLIMRYARANLIVTVDCLRREPDSEQWTLPKEIRLHYESDSASFDSFKFPMSGKPDGVFFELGFVYK
ncbi:MAG TPA: hypothetical protein DDZ88_14720 [Verrucomicrobiales bacterium]|nr:hypothetical protein [Verrucomicrobiales bacterium]